MSHSYRRRPATRLAIARKSKRAKHDRQTHYRRDWQVINERERAQVARIIELWRAQEADDSR